MAKLGCLVGGSPPSHRPPALPTQSNSPATLPTPGGDPASAAQRAPRTSTGTPRPAGEAPSPGSRAAGSSSL